MTTKVVETAEKVIAELESKRARLIEQGAEREKLRASSAYAALANDDAKARVSLDRINRETAEHNSELTSIDAALATARARLDEARRVEAGRADAARAKQLRTVLGNFVANGHRAHDLLAEFVEVTNAMPAALIEMHGLQGAHPFPSHEQFHALGSRCLRTVLMQTPWAHAIVKGVLQPTGTPSVVGGVATDLGDEDQDKIEAMNELQRQAQVLHAKRPDLSIDQCFDIVYGDRANGLALRERRATYKRFAIPL